ncbi:MAG TPA: adenylate/guanylate cyclase domain-containing protein [Myxococcota bacterium]|nr:adenylate/guanylate cyclase domain-containing protein [Myxococcota bacterium]
MSGQTRYAKSGDLHIAYQVVGEGDTALLYVPGWVSHVESIWEEPLCAAFLRRLASFSRLVLLDRRGVGMSDPVPRMPTLEERMDDVRAVMDAAGIERASLLGVSEGGPMCMLFAASFPERCASLGLVNTFARFRQDEATPWGRTQEDYEAFLAMVSKSWGTGQSADYLAPGLAKDPGFRERFARLERMAASPGRARMLLEIAFETDVRAVLPAIRVPTLVVHRERDSTISADAGRAIARAVPNARLVLVPGKDHFVFVGDTEPILSEIERFVTGSRASASADRVLATVLFCDVVGATERAAAEGDASWRELLVRHDRLVREQVGRFRGRVVDAAGDGHFASFDGPARAIHCAAALRDAARPLGLRLRQGVHTGECEAIGDKMAGLAVHIGARVAALAPPGEIWLTSTVRDLVVGSRLEFEERGRHALKGVPGEWTLLAARV